MLDEVGQAARPLLSIGRDRDPGPRSDAPSRPPPRPAPGSCCRWCRQARRPAAARCRGRVSAGRATAAGAARTRTVSAAGRARQGQETKPTSQPPPLPLGTGCHKLPKEGAQGGAAAPCPCRDGARRYGPRPEPRPEGGKSHAAREPDRRRVGRGGPASRNINPSEHRRRGGRVRAGRPGAGAGGGRGGQGGLPGLARPATPQQRADALDEIGTEILARKEELGRLLSREEGKTLPEGIGEATRAGQIFKFFAGEALAQSGELCPRCGRASTVEVTREPVGVVGLITPWNFPIAIPAWKIAPALAYGNCVVIKPADLVPGSRLGAGRDHQPRRAARGRVQPGDGPGLGGRPGADRVAATCTPSASPARSRPAAASPANCAAGMKKFQLEMGGKNPLVVLDDADLDDGGELRRAGGVLLDRPALHGELAADRRPRHPRPVRRGGDRRAAGAGGGRRAEARGRRSARWSTRSSSTRTATISGSAAGEGAKLAWGGERLNRETPGYYLQPALFTDTSNEMRINREEIFGPVATRDPRRRTTRRRWRSPTTRRSGCRRASAPARSSTPRISSATARPAW